MQRSRNEIRLSPAHPSLLLNLQPQDGWFAPLVVNQDEMLVDGYRRLQLISGEFVDVVQTQTKDLFDSAYLLNLRTRLWDPVDQFLWLRWAASLKVNTDRFTASFPAILWQAPHRLLQHLAARRLQLRQAQLILEAPDRCRKLLSTFLSERIELNANETARFIETSCDLMSRLKKPSLEDLFLEPELAVVLGNSSFTPRQKGEALLKAIRVLRYPEYESKLKEVSLLWEELGLDSVALLKKSEFVERGVLDITIRSTSCKDMKEKAAKFHESLGSPVWDKIWKDI